MRIMHTKEFGRTMSPSGLTPSRPHPRSDLTLPQLFGGETVNFLISLPDQTNPKSAWLPFG
jgi:hypothetical protein